jgi:hypothetical protein
MLACVSGISHAISGRNLERDFHKLVVSPLVFVVLAYNNIVD